MARRSRLGKITTLKTTRPAVDLDLDSARPGERNIASIAGRAGPDTRPLAPLHVAKLADSIAALGLLEPLVIDGNDRLLAGGHRLAALRLLAAHREQRADTLRKLVGTEEPLSAAVRRALEALPEVRDEDVLRAPVRVVPFDSSLDLDRALAIEAAENSQRRDYRPNEVRALYERLLAAGFTDRPGRPAAGERRARPVIAAVIGRSDRQVRNILNKRREAEALGDEGERALQRRRALRALDRAIERVYELDDDALDDVRAALARADVPARVARALAAARQSGRTAE